MGELTPMQRRVLDVIVRHLQETHSVPSSAQIGRRLGISRQTAYGHLQSLQQAGWIERAGGAYRLTRHRLAVETAWDRSSGP